MKAFYFIAIILVWGIIMTGMIVSADFKGIVIYLDYASLFILLLPVILLVKSQFSWFEIGNAFNIAFCKEAVKKVELERALLFFTAVQKYSLWTGFTGFILGMIAMFRNISDYTAVGRGLAIALLVILYAFILTFTIALPFQIGLKKKLIETSD